MTLETEEEHTETALKKDDLIFQIMKCLDKGLDLTLMRRLKNTIGIRVSDYNCVPSMHCERFITSESLDACQLGPDWMLAQEIKFAIKTLKEPK